MKYVFIILTLFLLACQDSKTNETNKEQAVSGDTKKKLLGIIHGGWVKQEYIDSIYKTKSPFRSYKQNEAYLELIIDTSGTTGDTIMNRGCLTNGKEGYYFTILLERDSSDSKKILMRMQYNIDYTGEDYFLEYAINKDTVLYMIQTYPGSNEVKSKTSYRRIYRNPPGNDYSKDPTNVFLDRTILKGSYKLYDASHKILNDNVVFTESGEVKGFPDFRHYYMESYFGKARLYNFDCMVLSSPGKSGEFRWTLDNGIFRLYELNIKGNPSDMGKLKYILERIPS